MIRKNGSDYCLEDFLLLVIIAAVILVKLMSINKRLEKRDVLEQIGLRVRSSLIQGLPLEIFWGRMLSMRRAVMLRRWFKSFVWDGEESYAACSTW